MDMLQTICQLGPFSSQLDGFKSGWPALKRAGPISNAFISLAQFQMLSSAWPNLELGSGHFIDSQFRQKKLTSCFV